MEHKDIPYIVYESTIAMSERHVKRLIIALIISITLLFSTNLIWLYEWCQYDYVDETETTTVMQDGEGTNIIGIGNEVDK